MCHLHNENKCMVNRKLGKEKKGKNEWKNDVTMEVRLILPINKQFLSIFLIKTLRHF